MLFYNETGDAVMGECSFGCYIDAAYHAVLVTVNNTRCDLDAPHSDLLYSEYGITVPDLEAGTPVKAADSEVRTGTVDVNVHSDAYTEPEVFKIEVLAKHILSLGGKAAGTVSYDLVKIDEKIGKNSLEDVHQFITMGLMSNNTIVDFINKYPSPSFASELNSRIAEEYNKLKKQGLEGVELFNELWSITSGYRDEYNYRSAGLGILAHFFEECEVFEK